VLLGTGSYHLGVVLSTRWVELARVDRALRFDVANGALLHHGGFMLVGGDWKIADHEPRRS
jgi:hypothetical protein